MVMPSLLCENASIIIIGNFRYHVKQGNELLKHHGAHAVCDNYGAVSSQSVRVAVVASKRCVVLKLQSNDATC
eukprot:scaffold299493_cov18-Prasinocladus_malaysianus.AAC.1